MSHTWNKTAGIPCFPRHHDPEAPCVLHALLQAEPWRNAVHWPEGFAGGIAHRLDISTSGALWLADDLQELADMRHAFSSGRLDKTYVMQAAKTVPWKHNVVDRPVAHDKRRKRRMVVRRGENTPHRGKWYAAHSTFEHLHGSIWRVQITTGVMHQIRVHAAFVGIPLLGDRTYGGGASPVEWPQEQQFRLHHVGLRGPEGLHTEAIDAPPWLSDAS